MMGVKMDVNKMNQCLKEIERYIIFFYLIINANSHIENRD